VSTISRVMQLPHGFICMLPSIGHIIALNVQHLQLVPLSNELLENECIILRSNLRSMFATSS